MKKITILLTDDHKLIREVWAQILNSEPNFRVVGECGSGEEAIEKSRALKPDIVLMDINLPGISGIETVQEIRKCSPDTKILCVSMHSNPVYVRKMMQVGAVGYITKNSSRDEMFHAISEVSEGRKYICKEIKNLLSDQMLDEQQPKDLLKSLSKRELEIMGNVKQGFSSREIANVLGISIKTVEVHRYNILKKLDLQNTPALVNLINSHPELGM